VAILLTCDCGRKLQIKEEFAGQEGTCPACGRTLHIPRRDDADCEPAFVGRAVPVGEPAEAAPAAREEAEEPVVNHAGGPLPPDADFFVRPPAEIGPVTSASSTLRAGKRPWSPGQRLLGAGVAGLAGLAVGFLIVTACDVRSDFWQAVWPLGGGGVGLGLVLLATGFKHTCTYVGREGVARFTCSGSRDHLTESAVFRFRDATELRTSQTLHYVNGVYQNTTFSFRWSDVGGRPRYEISGSHKSKAGTPGPKSRYHFARAAEVAWTVYLLGQVHRQLELSGSVAFNLKSGRWVRLGPGVITVCLDGEPVEVAAEDVAEADVDKGVVRLKRTDAREGWFSSTGVYRFSFEHLANAQLFFHLLDKLVGVRVR
jgi:hypothetical protein